MFLAAAFVTSCSDDESLASRGLETVEMPISISIPAEGFVNPTDVGIGNEEPASALAVTRAMGDPGTAETFVLPKYLYIYLVSTSSSNTTQVIFKKQKVESEDWKLSTSEGNTNEHFSAKDGLYVYQGHLSINLPLNRKEGRVYVVASNLDLDDSGTSSPNYYLVTDVSSLKSHTDVEDKVTFTNQSSLRNNMQNLYSSPYNLKNDDDGKYYGTIKDYASNVPHIDMVLYHVATKVDLQWTIDEQFQGTKAWAQVEKKKNGSDDTMRSAADNASEDYNKVFFSYIEARLLPKEKLPIFKPMNVTSSSGTFDAAFLGEEKDTKNLQKYKDEKGNEKTRKEYYQVLPETEKSGMYYGRKVIYVMPKLVTLSSGDYYYDITLKILVNNYTTSKKNEDGTYTSLLTAEDHATTGHHAQIKIMKSRLDDASKSTDGNPIFTPWIRATIHVNTVKDVENIVKFTNPVQ